MLQVDGPAHILANGWYGSKASAQQTCYSYRFQWARGANEWGGVTTKKPGGDDDFKVGPFQLELGGGFTNCSVFNHTWENDAISR